MNNVTLMGRLTRDVELRHTQTGTPVASFTLAVDRPFSKDGDVKADFIDIIVWRQTAEFTAKYFSKGMKAALTGRLQIRDWTDKENNKRRSAEVIADHVYFCESKKAGSDNGSDAGGGYQTPVSGSDFAEIEEDDGDLPF